MMMMMKAASMFSLLCVALGASTSSAFTFPLESPTLRSSRTVLGSSLETRDRYDTYTPSYSPVRGGALARAPRDNRYYSPYRGNGNGNRDLLDLWEQSMNRVTVQGGSLKTWSFSDPYMEQVQVLMKSEGRPLDASIEVWSGPGHTPQKLRVYLEDGAMRTVAVGFPAAKQRWGSGSISVRNTGVLEFPLEVSAEVDRGQGISSGLDEMQRSGSYPEQLQGGSVRSYPIDPAVDSMAVLLETDGRPLQARIEVLTGPSNEAQIMELYSEDGLDCPMYMVLDTPGSQNSIRIVNTASVEFPVTVTMAPFSVGRYPSYEYGYGGYGAYGSYSNGGGRWT